MTTAALASAGAGCTGKIGNPSDGEGRRDQPNAADHEAAAKNAAVDDKFATSMAAGCSGSIIRPGRSPLRRLTRFEYNNTLRDLLGDNSNPAKELPSEELGNGFGNDADALSVSTLLAERYSSVAAAAAERAVQNPTTMGKLAPCQSSLNARNEEACAREIVASMGSLAYRRPLEEAEVADLLNLFKGARIKSTFATSIATVFEAVLQAPDFLYRIELGEAEAGRLDRLRPRGYEMATRLSYLFWSTMPDQELRGAAASGQLANRQGVERQAARLLADERARPMVRYFFDNLLPLGGLTDLQRDKTLFPTFSAEIGGLMRKETQSFLEQHVFEGVGGWPSAFTAPFSFVNGPLAAFYGMTGVSGNAFRRVPLDPKSRLGLLTQGSVLAGTTHSNVTSPVKRGAFVMRKFLCKTIPLPSKELLSQVTPPDPYFAPTARQRYAAHSENPVCATCHAYMDPVGFALENFDAVGLFRLRENGVTIDATGGVPDQPGVVNGAVELARKLATADGLAECFASQWLTFGYGRAMDDGDQCTSAAVQNAFAKSGYDVKELLAALVQTDAFLYLPSATVLQERMR